MGSVFRDLRFAFRTLAKKPVYTAAALLALGLGVGANTALFSVFDAVLLEPLAYPEAGRLVRLWEANQGKDIAESRMSPVTFNDIRDQAASFTALAGWWHPDLNLTSGEGEPHRAAAINVTDEFFDVIGVAPALGRGFVAGEDESGKPRIAVISHGLWQRRWGGDPGVLGHFSARPQERALATTRQRDETQPVTTGELLETGHGVLVRAALDTELSGDDRQLLVAELQHVRERQRRVEHFA